MQWLAVTVLHMSWSSNNAIIQNAIGSGYGSSAVNQVVMSNVGNSTAIANGNNNFITMSSNNAIIQNAIGSGYGSSAVNQVVMSNFGNSTAISNSNNAYGYQHSYSPSSNATFEDHYGNHTQGVQSQPDESQTHNYYYGDTIIGDGNIQGDNNNVANGSDFSTNMLGRETFRFTEKADTLTIQGDGRDRITNFDAEDDTIYLDADELMDGNLSDGTIYIAHNRRDVRWYAERSHELIYFERQGKLLYDGNGSQRGLGDGGQIAKLIGSPDLYSDSIQIV